MVELEKVEADEDAAELREPDREAPRSTPARPSRADVLARWDEALPQFVKVMPTDYKRVLEEQQGCRNPRNRRGRMKSVSRRGAETQRMTSLDMTRDAKCRSMRSVARLWMRRSRITVSLGRECSSRYTKRFSRMN